MEKTITKYICDDCGKELDTKPHNYIHGLDLCDDCTRARVDHSFSLIEMGSRKKNCEQCKGEGVIHQFTYDGDSIPIDFSASI